MKIDQDMIFRDRFDWDLNEISVRPQDFARKLLSGYKHNYSNFEAAVRTLSNQILDQIDAHTQKHTHFPRSRLNGAEQDLIKSHGICINCNSLLTKENPEFCFQCCTQYDKRPNAREPAIEQYNLSKPYSVNPAEDLKNPKKRIQKTLEKTE